MAKCFAILGLLAVVAVAVASDSVEAEKAGEEKGAESSHKEKSIPLTSVPSKILHAASTPGKVWKFNLGGLVLGRFHIGKRLHDKNGFRWSGYREGRRGPDGWRQWRGQGQGGRSEGGRGGRGRDLNDIRDGNRGGDGRGGRNGFNDNGRGGRNGFNDNGRGGRNGFNDNGNDNRNRGRNAGGPARGIAGGNSALNVIGGNDFREIDRAPRQKHRQGGVALNLPAAVYPVNNLLPLGPQAAVVNPLNLGFPAVSPAIYPNLVGAYPLPINAAPAPVIFQQWNTAPVVLV